MTQGETLLDGRLRNVPLRELFQVLATGQKEGALEVGREGQQAVLLLSDGRIRYASLRPGVHLGEVLVRMDLLSTAEVQAILASQLRENAGAPLGLAALRAGLLDESQLAAAVRRQVSEVVAQLLTWRDGTFRFVETATDSTYVPDDQAVDAMAILLEVAGQLQDEDAARVEPGAVFERSGDPTTVTLPDGAWEVLEQVDGRRSARSLAADIELAERRVYAVLGRLEAVGVLRRLPVEPEEPVVLVLCPSEAVQRLIGLLVERSGGVPVIAQSAEALGAMVERRRPRAVIVDDAGSGWEHVAELRATPGLAHLPMVLLTNARRGISWRPWRRTRVDVLTRPFDELELASWLERWIPRSPLRG